MIIASEIRQRLPQETGRLEGRVKAFQDYHDSNVYVAQAQYQALMDVPDVEDGRQLDDAKAKVFNFEFGSHSRLIRSGHHNWIFTSDGPGIDAYYAVGVNPGILPYFREDIHGTYVSLKRKVRAAANKLIAKMIQQFYGDDYKGIYLDASKFSEDQPAYVPFFTKLRKSGHWDYAADFSADGKLVAPPAQVIDNPSAFDNELCRIIAQELEASHKSARFVQWAIGTQPPPNEVRLGAYDIVYASDEPAIEEETSIAFSLARVGGLVVADGSYLSDLLLQGHRNLRPFFTAEDSITLGQFLLKTK